VIIFNKGKQEIPAPYFKIAVTQWGWLFKLLAFTTEFNAY